MAKIRKKKKQSRKIVKRLLAVLLVVCVSVGYAVYKGQISDFDDLLVYLGLKHNTVATMEDSALVHFIDVGQGDCALIQIDDKNILIDGGENNCGSRVVSYLFSVGVKKIDLIIASHPHSDHIGGLDTVMSSFDTEQLIMADIAKEMLPTSKSYEDLINTAKKENVTVTTASLYDRFTFYGGVFTVLGPVREYNNLNSDSLIIQFDYGNHSFLFTGDCERKAEYELINTGYLTHVDVLKVAHHGGKDATTMKFLTTLSPSYGVISCGTDNDYGHPHSETLERLTGCGVKPLITAELGNIVFETDGNKLVYTTSKGE